MKLIIFNVIDLFNILFSIILDLMAPVLPVTSRRVPKLLDSLLVTGLLLELTQKETERFWAILDCTDYGIKIMRGYIWKYPRLSADLLH